MGHRKIFLRLEELGHFSLNLPQASWLLGMTILLSHHPD
jgi:hypothetical protein